MKKQIFNFKYINDEQEFILQLPYCEFIEKINGEDFKKHYIVDIRKLSENDIKIIFDNFDNLQAQFLSKSYFLKKFNIMLYILHDKKQTHEIYKKQILNNYDFALKKFITEEELNNVLKYDNDMKLSHQTKIDVNCNNKHISIIDGFNLIYGPNNSGKTSYLKAFSTLLECPIFNMNDKNLTLNIDNTNQYLQELLNTFNLNIEKEFPSNIEQYFYRLSQIIAYCKINNIPLLLDDLGWNSLDTKNKLELINTLFEFSKENTTIVTACQNDVKKMIKRHIYKPNINNI